MSYTHTYGHRCHAKKCNELIPPKLFMCHKHWYMVPSSMQRMIWHFYVAGQEVRKDPSREYITAAFQAIEYVAKQEGVKENVPKTRAKG